MNFFKSLLAFLFVFVATLFTASDAQAFALGNHVGGFFLGTLDCAEENSSSTRDLCRENGWLNYDTLSGCAVATKKVTPSPAGCFVAGTLVATSTGFAEIQDIEIGEQVWSYNVEAEEWQLNEVVETFVHEYSGDVVTVTVDGLTVEATGNHPFWVVEGASLDDRPIAFDVSAEERNSYESGRWVEARSLLVGDLLLLQSGLEVEVDALTVRQESLQVYNIEVANNHTYAVSEDAVLVHNKAAAMQWTKTARIKDAQLPTSGKFRFIAPKNWNPSNPAKGPQGGYIDKFGNEWVKGPSRTQGQAFEWDVQIPKHRRELFDNKAHLNISLDGHVTH